MNITLLCGDQQNIVTAAEGESLLEVIRKQNDLPVHSPCGGAGTCRKCTVWLVNESGEEAVLACRTPAQDGMTVRLPGAAPLMVELCDHLHSMTCASDSEAGYGIACDIGTTTVVCHLVNLSTGARLATVGEGNAQRSYGGDVIARIKASMDGQRPALTSAIRGQLARMVEALCRETGIAPDQISAMAVAANTTMCHLLIGLAPDSIGVAPFTPLSRFGTEMDARELGLPFEGTVYIAPAVSGYVGGDITADILAAELDKNEKPVLLVDIGTNGEMALGCGERFLCCSTAAGPAFEGAQICCGMTAAPGAISRVDWDDGELKCTVLGDGEAVGLCGSALVDGVAVMLELGVLDETGRILEEDEIPQEGLPYLIEVDGQPAFRLTDKVFITQSDVRKLQLGKGAIAAGLQVLMNACNLDCSEVAELLLAGGFGSYIRPESAARIGLIPAELLPVTRAIGNSAAFGAQMALVSREVKQRLTALQNNMEYLELSGLPEFNDAYLEAMMFPETE